MIRHARDGDAAALARLVDLAGEGIPSRLWSSQTEGEETPFEVGARRAAREEGAFSYRNAHVIEADRRVVAMLLGYRQPDPCGRGDLLEMPSVIRPLIELESLAPGSWYVNVLAVFPDHQGRGFGTRLLALAEELAGISGAEHLSIIVAAENSGAVRLYRRTGYVDTARRPVVPFPGFGFAGDWLLMVKEVGQ